MILNTYIIHTKSEKTIEVNAEDWIINWEKRSFKFVIKDRIVAIFSLDDIEGVIQSNIYPLNLEVVRCKNCKLSLEDKLFGGYWCNGKQVNPNFFCGHAIRKDESQPTEPEAEKKAERDAMTLTLNGYITEEQWDAITDVDFDHTNEIFFNTKHGKVVKFVKVRSEKG